MHRLTSLVLVCSALSGCADEERGGLATPAALASIMAGSRPVEPMLTAFSQQPCAVSDEFGETRGAGSRCAPFPRPGSDRFTTLSRLARRLAAASDEAAAPAMLHTRGLWYLLWEPSSATVDRSIGALRGAMAWSPSSADIRSDLAAAYYLRSGAAADPRDLLVAIEYAEQALYIERSHRPAAFNRDLALVAMGLLPHEEIERDPLANRRLLDLRLLPAWGRSCGFSHGGRSDRETRELRRLAEELTTITGDTLPMATVEAIEAARRSHDLTRLRELCQGHVLYAEAVRAYEAGFLEKARSTFRRSGAALAAAQSPFAIWPTFYEAVHLYYDQDFAAAERQLEAVREEAARRGYLHLDARSSWVLGVIEINRGNRQRAIDSYRWAAALLDRTGELGSRAYVAALLGEALDSVGLVRVGWQERLVSLKGLDHLESARQRHNVLFLALEAVERESLPHAALYFGEELLRRAEASGDPLLRAEAHRLRAQTLARVEQRTEAYAHLTIALSLAEEIGPAALRERVLTDVLLTRGRLELAYDPRAAVQTFSAVQGMQEGQGRSFHLPELLLARARALILQGRLDEAESDLRRAVELFERDLALIGVERDRRALVGIRSSIFTELMRIDLRRGRFGAAVDHLERVRSTSIPAARRSRGDVGALRLRVIAQNLPQDVALIYFSVVDGDIWVWTVDHRMMLKTLRLKNRATEVERFTADLVGAAAASVDARLSKHAAAHLYDLLVKPWISRVPQNTMLVVIADGPVALVPFGALFDAEMQRFLFERHPVLHALSGTSFVRGLASRSSAPTAPSLYVVAAESESSFPRVGAEARQIAAFYSEARLETTVQSAQALLAAARRYSVIHLGMHATVTGSERVLVLGTGSKEHAIAPAEIIAISDLSSTSVVVLAACATAAGRPTSVTGTDDLVWPFLAAGVATVIAPVAAVEDAETVTLMRELHERLATGVAPVDALQQSQRELLKATSSVSDHVPSWVWFQSYGGPT